MFPVQSRSSSTSNISGGTPTPHSLATNRRRERCMGTYAMHRVLLFLPTLLLATVLVFALFWIVPGDPALTILGGGEGDRGTVSPEQLQQLRQRLGLDRPIYVQYASWLGYACRRIHQARREGMDFVALVDQVIALLRQRGRVTYRTLQRQFQLDADALADLLGELRYAHRDAMREDEQGIVWTDDAHPTPPAAATPAEQAARASLTYTPSYLAEKILTSRSALEGERKQVTVLFADLKGSMELLADRDPEE